MLLALAQAAPFDTKADYIALARQRCAEEWPADFTMQEYCMKGQARGMLTFKQVSEEMGPAFYPTLEKCTEEWTKNRNPDWAMIGYCASRQAEAWRRLNPPSGP